MDFHADHSLFFARPTSIRRATIALAVALGVLIVNASVDSAAVSLSGAGIGVLLLVLTQTQGTARIQPVVAWVVAVVGLSLVAGAGLGADTEAVTRTGSRVLCGAVWILWLGTEVDWAALRAILLALRFPTWLVRTLDQALMHGVLTQREWTKRRDAARLRLGASRLKLGTWGQLLSDGALHAFVRLEQVEENATVRGAAAATSGTTDSIKVVDVDVELDGNEVLEGINLDVKAGEWILLCGPSGAGKSTLLRLFAGLQSPSRGCMTRFGLPVGSDSNLSTRLDGRVALLTQNPEHHFLASTVSEDIVWGLLRRGVAPSEAEARSKEMATALGICDLLHRPCHQLSFGEQRRVALAGLLVLEPSLLLLDEPTAGLDPVAALEMKQLVEESVKRTGAACIWATHDLRTVPPKAERVVLLRGGAVVFDGPTAEGLSIPWLLRAGLAVPGEREGGC